jgi:diguanylate cyclase (GGDEF)-like protein
MAEALALLTQGLRDIDLAVPLSGHRFLVFLPHTGHAGSVVVADRLRTHIRALTAVSGVTASVGISSFEGFAGPSTQVTFGTMMKAATEAVQKAQAEGGDRVETGQIIRKSRVSMG